MNESTRYKHRIWLPITGVEPIPLQPTPVYYTEGARTNYEAWQMERYGNYVKADGTEHLERFVKKGEGI
jgi:hypothetical protein